MTCARALSIAATAGFLAACGPGRYYQQPDPAEPHAILKLRVAYHEMSGPELDETVSLAGYALPAPTVDGPRRFTRAYRIRPGEPQSVRVGSHFFHVVTVPRREQYTEQERYPCGSQTTGFGSSQRTTTRYCSRTVIKYRTVYDRRVITDGECERRGTIAATPGDVYVLQYDYYMNAQCNLRCMRQLPEPDGSFRMVPCSAI